MGVAAEGIGAFSGESGDGLAHRLRLEKALAPAPPLRFDALERGDEGELTPAQRAEQVLDLSRFMSRIAEAGRPQRSG
jgi:hypothetical protein